MKIRFLFFACSLFCISHAYGADDINIVPSPRCGDLLTKIGVRGVNPLFLVYKDDVNESIETTYKNIESVESGCPEIIEVLLETKASLLLHADRKPQAKKIMGILLERKPDSWTVMQSAGLFYDALGEYEKAIYFFEKAKKKDSDWTINADLAVVYYKAGRDEDAVKAYQTALRLNPRTESIKEAKESYFAACKRLRNYPKCS